MPYVVVDGYVTWLDDDSGTSTITAQDGSGDSTTPVIVDGFAPQAESGNVVHKMIAPGQIAVTLVGDLPRTGTLTLVYDNDIDAEAAREMLGRPTSFLFEDVARPVVNMEFVRAGGITPALHNEARDIWVFEVGFQEVS